MDGVIEVRGGRVRGVHRHDHWSFAGIPYAASPAGAGRFRPPAPPDPWSGVRPADRFGPWPPRTRASSTPPSVGSPSRSPRTACTSTSDPRARRRSAAGDGLDPRRVVRLGIGVGRPLPGRHPGPGGGRGGGHHQLPARPARVPGPPGPGRARPVVAGRRGLDGIWKLGPGRPGGSPPVGAGPHRRLRRRPGQRDRVRGVGRRHERRRAVGRTGRPGPVPPGHRPERWPLRLHPRRGRRRRPSSWPLSSTCP